MHALLSATSLLEFPDRKCETRLNMIAFIDDDTEQDTQKNQKQGLEYSSHRKTTVSMNDFRIAESSGALPGIEIFSQAVADEVKGKYGERDGDTGKDQCMWGSLQS